jgi:NAD(P)H-dependent FMN reductase
MHLLTVSGSLRAGSSNHRLLEAVRLLAPGGWSVTPCTPLDALPHFNPDLEEAGPPPAAARWRAEIGACDALLISCPEYIHGVPGTMKNALDWLAGGMEMAGKPTVLLNATPPSPYATASLLETLRVLGANVLEKACLEIPLRGSPLEASGIAAHPVFSARLRAVFEALRE